WQAAVATVLGLVAKEEVVGVLGSLSSMASADAAMGLVEAGDSAKLALIGQEFFDGSRLAAFSFMIFNLLCAPCFAAMGAIKREMNSPKWTWFAIGYMTAFAYAISLIVYQIGLLITGTFSIWSVVAIIVLAALIYLLVRKNKYSEDTLTMNVK
ncbi:MAG: ferrous iron transporter B, partial [Oscillospiraceae bacterium]|nr:ferrous iron transporter B [Oscillospiraceae bacterium]